MSKKGTITSRTLEKLGFSGFRFRSNTQPGTQEELERKKGLSDNTDKTQTSVTTITGGELEIPEKPQKKTLKEKLLGSKFGGEESASSSVFYIDQPNELETQATNADTSAQTVEYNTMQEKKKKVQPEGTQEYEVQDRDTLEKIAAHFDTTPSELKKINKLISTMIFAKQIMFVPDKDYVSTRASVSSIEESSNTSISPFGSPLNKPAMDIPLIKAVNSSPTRIPGHAERLTSVSSTKDEDFEIIPPHKLSEDEVQQLDQDCMERFIKLNVKHITDGQGVVKGVLLVTPNAVMFDPDVSDALVLEHGAEKYGMIAPMDLIISAAMYHDIAAMKLRGTVMEDGSLYPKPEVYRDKEHCCQKHVQDTSANLQSQPGPECSCNEGETVMSVSDDENGKTLGIDRVTEEFNKLKTDLDDICDAGGNTDKTDDTSDVFIDHVDSHFDNSNEESESKEMRGPKLQKGQKKLSVSFSLPDSDSLNDKQTEATKADKPDEAESDNNDVVNLDDHSVHHMKEIVEEENGKCADEEDKKTRIGSIVYLPVEDDSNGQVSLEALTETQKTLSEMSNSKFEETSKSDSNLADSVATKTENKNVEKTRSASTSSLGPFSPTPHLNAFVNYATGFFQRNPSDSSVKDMKDVIQDSVEELKKSDITTIFGGSPKPGKRRGKMSRNTDLAHMEVAVESAVTMDEKPDLLTMDYDITGFAPRKSVTFPDPPLYLCLRLGTPQNKNVFQHNYSNEAYGKRRKKSEYWFSIPRDKVDHLYAFFVQWSPQIYGDADEISAEARGFVVFEEGVDEEGLEVLDEHFGPHSNFHKDWEIISKDEYRRRSIVFDIPLPLPELIGESSILEDEHIRDISQNMPGRTVGYPWTLIYSTDKHGFSLKTLYRDMQGLDSPVLLVVKDTNDQVFGALSSCELKYSDHFYGTGESFLFTFYPEFKVFNWTGENNFFIKGNKESLTIGAGQGVFGLWFDEDLYHGRTNKCETFDNDLLTINEDFVVKGFEGWAFMWDSNC